MTKNNGIFLRSENTGILDMDLDLDLDLILDLDPGPGPDLRLVLRPASRISESQIYRFRGCYIYF